LRIVLIALIGAACATSDEPAPGTSETTQAATTVAPAVTTRPPSLPSPTAPLSTLPPRAAVCDAFIDVAVEGTLGDPVLREISGIVSSSRYPDVLWAHNDSRGGASVHAVATNGRLLATWQLEGVVALDWEDIAAGPGGPEGDYLYVGDIGDNFSLRSEIVVYRFPEPDVRNDGIVTDFQTFRLTYPGAGPGPNAEALAVDPVTGDLLVIAKDRVGPELVYRASGALLRDGLPTELELIASLDLGGRAEVTAADFTANGDRLAMRGYDEIWIWPRRDADLSETLAAEPCRAASPDEVQGEALTFDGSGLNLYTVSEGTGAAVNRVGVIP
jgi:hypothetical protein